MSSDDPFDLARFVEAQRDSFETALHEIRAGRKRSHWMWFIFPQLAGLGRSPVAKRYGIVSLAEARAYLAHPVLGPRLTAMLDALRQIEHADPERVFGPVDAMKLRSSLTLFAQAEGRTVFDDALDRWFGGQRDDTTLGLLGR